MNLFAIKVEIPEHKAAIVKSSLKRKMFFDLQLWQLTNYSLLSYNLEASIEPQIEISSQESSIIKIINSQSNPIFTVIV